MQSALKIPLAVVMGLLLLRMRSAGAVQISFLAEDSALNDTATFLARHGCPQENCDAFKGAVRQYFSGAFDSDLSRFPAPTNGFYSFASMSNLLAALPYPFFQTSHSWGLNCFDTIILLANGSLRVKQGPDESLGTFWAASTRDLTNSPYEILQKATPREAYLVVYPEWARQLNEGLFPAAMRQSRVCLIAALSRFYWLPESVTDKTLSRDILESLRSAWTEEGLVFPQHLEVVLCHDGVLPDRFCLTGHAALLYRRKQNGYTLIEKAGGSGPFVRLDLDSKEDVLVWLAAAFRGIGDPNSRRFVTFNANEIRPLADQMRMPLDQPGQPTPGFRLLSPLAH